MQLIQGEVYMIEQSNVLGKLCDTLHQITVFLNVLPAIEFPFVLCAFLSLVLLGNRLKLLQGDFTIDAFVRWRRSAVSTPKLFIWIHRKVPWVGWKQTFHAPHHPSSSTDSSSSTVWLKILNQEPNQTAFGCDSIVSLDSTSFLDIINILTLTRQPMSTPGRWVSQEKRPTEQRVAAPPRKVRPI